MYEAQVAARITIDASGCWLWTGPTLPNGYGVFTKSGQRAPAYVHREMYEQTKGPIPPTFDIDHLCRVRNCCNPGHLEAVTHRTNLLRGDTFAARNAAKTHCPQNHEYTPENTRYAAGAPNKRKCRACVREACRRYQQKRKARA